jgi:predicted DCC family thiol-disulfide oxidoreductase YuxK
MVYVANGRIFLKSTAALRALGDTGGVWAAVRLLLVVPPVVRNAVYDLVVMNRYKVFGRLDRCRLPSAEERAFFLD